MVQKTKKKGKDASVQLDDSDRAALIIQEMQTSIREALELLRITT